MDPSAFTERCKRAMCTREGRFTSVFLLTIFGIVVVAVAVVLLVDPYGDFETGVLEPIVLKDRTVKMDLLAEQEEVDTLIFGSSVAFGLDPTLISEYAFNLSVGGAYPNDFYALLRYSVEELDVMPSKIILGITPASFVNQGHPDINTNPRLRKYVMDDPDASLRDFNPVFIFLKKFNADYVRDIVRSVYAQVWKKSSSHYSFDARGFLVIDDGTMDDVFVPGNYDRMLTFYDGMKVPHDRYVRFFDKTLAYAREHDIEVDILILPIHPLTQEQLRLDTSYDEFGVAVREMLRLGAGDSAVIHDMSDVASFGGLRTGFLDADHMDKENNTRLLEYLY